MINSRKQGTFMKFRLRDAVLDKDSPSLEAFKMTRNYTSEEHSA
jgi:hypothetical protein